MSNPPARRRYRKVKKDKEQDRRIVRLERYIKPEMKYKRGSFGTPGTGVNILNSSSVVTLLNGLQKGTDGNQRIGHEIRIGYIEVNIFAQNLSATANYDAINRYMLYFDRDPGGILDYPINANPFVDAVIHLNDYQKGKFRILMDKTGKDLHQYQKCEVIKYRKYFKNPIKCEYQDNSGTITDLTRNSLLLHIFTNDPTPSNIFVWGHVMIGYYDN